MLHNRLDSAVCNLEMKPHTYIITRILKQQWHIGPIAVSRHMILEYWGNVMKFSQAS
jgi:hypothetical protein